MTDETIDYDQSAPNNIFSPEQGQPRTPGAAGGRAEAEAADQSNSALSRSVVGTSPHPTSCMGQQGS